MADQGAAIFVNIEWTKIFVKYILTSTNEMFIKCSLRHGQHYAGLKVWISFINFKLKKNKAYLLIHEKQ